ncbi:Fur family transcriptional regulator [Elusimicrobiota bacterium]
MGKRKELEFFPRWAAGRSGYAERVREVFSRYLEGKGLLATPQRAAILDRLLAADRHISQEELYAAVRSRGIGKVTVFRTLKLLQECGVLDKVIDGKGRARYEVKSDRPHHDHFVCVRCGGIIEIQWPELEKVQGRIAKKLGVTVLYHKHELFGLCGRCGKAKRD